MSFSQEPAKIRMRISFATLPVYPSAVEMYVAGVHSGSNAGNRQHCSGASRSRLAEREPKRSCSTSDNRWMVDLPPYRGEADGLVRNLHEAGIPWALTVGETQAGTPSMVIES